MPLASRFLLSPSAVYGFCMHNYPIYVSLTGASVVVAGAGGVGRRKIASLSQAGAREIRVFDPALADKDIAELEKSPGVVAFARRLKKDDLKGSMLVFAASSDRRVNARIAAWCAAADIWCNVADDTDLCSFIVPAIMETHGLMAAFSTGGKSPALAARVREEARSWIEANHGRLVVFMERVRPLVLDIGLGSAENAVIFRNLAYSRLGELLAGGDMAAVRDLLAIVLPASLHCHIEELLDGLC